MRATINPRSFLKNTQLHIIAAKRPTVAMSIHIRVFVKNLVRTFFSRFLICFSVFSACFSGEVSFSVARSPRKSSSDVTSNISAMAGISERSGAVSSRSQRLTALSDMPSLSASSLCVSHFAFRSMAMNVPIDFLSIIILLVLVIL